jgi:hypothetical protein
MRNSHLTLSPPKLLLMKLTRQLFYFSHIHSIRQGFDIHVLTQAHKLQQNKSCVEVLPHISYYRLGLSAQTNELWIRFHGNVSLSVLLQKLNVMLTDKCVSVTKLWTRRRGEYYHGPDLRQIKNGIHCDVYTALGVHLPRPVKILTHIPIRSTFHDVVTSHTMTRCWEK